MSSVKGTVGEHLKDSECITRSVKHIIDDIRNIPVGLLDNQPQWIPISERLPEEATPVLVSCEDYYLSRLNPCIGWRHGVYWRTFTAKGCESISYPIAWMPLPKPYKEGSEE